MKGSGVRVSPSALRSLPASAVVPAIAQLIVDGLWGLSGVWNGGPEGSCEVHPSRKLGGGPLPLDEGPTEYLTVAEAAARLRCCERTIRRTSTSGCSPTTHGRRADERPRGAPARRRVVADEAQVAAG